MSSFGEGELDENGSLLQLFILGKRERERAGETESEKEKERERESWLVVIKARPSR